MAQVDANSSNISLHLKLAKLSADRVLTDSEFHTVGPATVKERDAIEVSILEVVEAGVQ